MPPPTGEYRMGGLHAHHVSQCEAPLHKHAWFTKAFLVDGSDELNHLCSRAPSGPLARVFRMDDEAQVYRTKGLVAWAIFYLETAFEKQVQQIQMDYYERGLIREPTDFKAPQGIGSLS